MGARRSAGRYYNCRHGYSEIRIQVVRCRSGSLITGATIGCAAFGSTPDASLLLILLTLPITLLTLGLFALVINGLLGPFNLQVKVALAAGFVLASPVWLYELWAFVTPGLQRNERRWTIGFLATGVPLFIAGCAFCYLILPRTTKVLLGFTPDQVGSIVDFNDFLSIVIRLMIVFGLGFEMPVFVVMLNLLGVLPARRLAGWWRQIVLGIFLFAAIATPTGDPLTMTVLAVPLCILVLLSYLVARANDIRRGRRDVNYANLDDDQASPLDDRPEPVDDTGRHRHHDDDDIT